MKEETLALILEENVRKNPAKPWISNRQIYVGFGTALTIRWRDENPSQRNRFRKQRKIRCTVWRPWLCEQKQCSEASTGSRPNSAAGD
jgi:hypothetical protein